MASVPHVRNMYMYICTKILKYCTTNIVHNYDHTHYHKSVIGRQTQVTGNEEGT